MLPLTRRAGGIQAYKLIIPAGGRPAEPDLKTHEGYEWLYVLDGRLRLVLGEHDLVLAPGEAAEFDTRMPHWFGAAGRRAGRVPQPVRQAGRARPPARPPRTASPRVRSERAKNARLAGRSARRRMK